jgi:hypothetical protein
MMKAKGICPVQVYNHQHAAFREDIFAFYAHFFFRDALKFATDWVDLTRVKVWRIQEDICVAKGKALANTDHGAGGATQYYVSSQDSGKLRGGKVRPI